MVDPPVQLVLADDWELRGDGSGNMRAMQFATLVSFGSVDCVRSTYTLSLM